MANKKVKVQSQSTNIYDFVVLTGGIKLTRFQKNPVMLYMHDYNKLIGKWENLSTEGTDIFASPVFNTKNLFAKEKEQEFNDGFLNGTSLGLKPVKWAMGSEYGLPAETLVLAESELKEISLCTVGANEDTVVLYDNNGQVMSESQVKDICLSVSPQPSQQSKPNTMDFKTLIITTLGLNANATDADITAALTNLKNDHVTLSAAKVEWEKKEKQRAIDAVKTELDAAEKDGRITAEQRPSWESILTNDFNSGKIALSGIKPSGANPVNLAAAVEAAKPGESTEKKVELKTISDYFVNGKADELQKLKKENRKAYIELCAASGVNENDIDWS